MAKHNRQNGQREVTAAVEVGAPDRGEQLPCLVVRSTPDGYVVGRALVDASAVEWISPRHVRPWLESRPKDVRIPALVQANIGGNTRLKPARVVKGRPVQTQVGIEVVFGEALDAMALRAKRELKEQVAKVVKDRRTWWRHLCERDGYCDVSGARWATWRALPHGEACDCGATEGGKKAKVA